MGTKGIMEICPFNNQIVVLEMKSERQYTAVSENQSIIIKILKTH
jgi:hypothetical protein